MKVAVINFSGNVGKTTVSANVLKPRLDDAPIFSVESINTGAESEGIDVEKIRGKKFGDLIDQLMTIDSAVIDVGASNAEDFLKLMQQYHGSHEEFDMFIVPTVKERKVQSDTVNTIRSLQQLGIDKSKIHLVFNKVDTDENIEAEFAALFGLQQAENGFTINSKATIYSNEVFERSKGVKKSLAEISADPTDYRQLLRGETDENKKDHLIQMIAIKRLAVTANKNLDDVFDAIFNPQ